MGYFLNLRTYCSVKAFSTSYFSRKDIEVVAGSGCPSTDRKVVNSGKRLRAHVDIDEGNVCSSCILRGNCERAYVMASEGEGGQTVDLMRILLTYGLDPITSTVENMLCRSKTIEESARRLLKAMVEFGSKEFDSLLPNATSSKKAASLQESLASAEKGRTNLPIKQGDWLCPKCNFLNFARNIKCLRCNDISQERLRKLWEDQDHLPLKKGDWICNKCNFLNFARNTICLQCKEKPPKRELNPGDWECDSCNFINFGRNMVCLKCDHKRPKASNSSGASAQPGHEIRGFSSYHKGSRFVKDEDETGGEPPIRQETQSPNNGTARWRFVEDESKDIDGSKSWDGISGFVDFPIAGGKSELSQNSSKRSKWKAEMLEKSRPHSRGGESRSASLQRRPEFVECSSDEEMAEWFGHGKRMQMEE